MSINSDASPRTRHLLFIGPDKTGSTWFHSLFASAAEVAAPRIKDPFYFDRHYHLGQAWYDSLFQAENRIRLDVSHDYLFSDRAAERIQLDLERSATTLVVGVREPIDRAHSAWRYMKSQGRVAPDATFADSIRSIPELLDHGDYGLHLLRWSPWAERVELMSFDALRSDSDAEFERMARAIGVEAAGIEADANQVINAARSARNPALVKFGRRTANLLRDRGATQLVHVVKESQLAKRLLFTSSDPAAASREELEEARELHRNRIDDSLGRANEIVPSALWGNLLSP